MDDLTEYTSENNETWLKATETEKGLIGCWITRSQGFCERRWQNALNCMPNLHHLMTDQLSFSKPERKGCFSFFLRGWTSSSYKAMHLESNISITETSTSIFLKMEFGNWASVMNVKQRSLQMFNWEVKTNVIIGK